MALLNRLDPAALTEHLIPWLTDTLGVSGTVTMNNIEIPTASGMSSETVLFDVEWEDGGDHHSRGLVLRIPPSGEGLFPDYDIVREGRVMAAVAAHTTAAVPTVVATDPDGELLGTPFLLLERVFGTVPSDDPPFVTGGWVVDLTPEQRATMFDNALQSIAAIQQADPAAIGLADLGRSGGGTTPIEREVDYWRNFYSWASDGRPSPTIDAAFEKLAGDIPATTGPTVITWGDARFGNLMFDENLAVSGVFDWEMATLGPAEVDFGYFLFFDQVYSSGLGLPRLTGFPERSAAIARFEELIGRRVEHLEWFEAWGALRGAILLQRVGNLMISQGLLPPDAEMPFNNPAAQVLAALLGLPAPTGQIGWITGNR